MSVETLRKWVDENPERYREQKAEYKKEHPEANRKTSREYARRIRRAVLILLGSRCSNCGFSDYRALQVDHKDGGGNKERRLLGPHGVFRKILKMQKPEKKYQLLCANCNWIKKFIQQELGVNYGS